MLLICIRVLRTNNRQKLNPSSSKLNTVMSLRVKAVIYANEWVDAFCTCQNCAARFHEPKTITNASYTVVESLEYLTWLQDYYYSFFSCCALSITHHIFNGYAVLLIILHLTEVRNMDKRFSLDECIFICENTFKDNLNNGMHFKF